MILLDHRVTEQISTRRLRVVKHRGSTHGTNENPFLIDEHGITVMPITTAGLDHAVSDERVGTGVPRLDSMLDGGYYRGSTVLVSGTAGSGKSSIAAHFADAFCRRGERCLYLSFEESPDQIIRNMRSIGIDLQQHRETKLLEFFAARPTMRGLESHLAVVNKLVGQLSPAAVVVDPIGNLTGAGDLAKAHLMVVRLIDYMKMRRITALMTSLTRGGSAEEATDIAISSIVDTWLLLRNVETRGERNRTLQVIKSRGMSLSNKVYECVITSCGVELRDVYVDTEAVLTGAARERQERRQHERDHTRSERARGASSRSSDGECSWSGASRCSAPSSQRKRRPCRSTWRCRRPTAPRRGTASPRRRTATSHEIERNDGVSCVAREGEPMAEGAASSNTGSAGVRPGASDEWTLRLYVAGDNRHSRAALHNLRGLCDRCIGEGRYVIEVIDLMKRPQLAKADQILAIPTLVRRVPEPVKRVVGTLSDTERAMRALDIRQRDAAPDTDLL